MIELPPAGTLTGLVKRALPGVETVALKTPADLEAARDLVARHGSQSPLDDSPDLADARRPRQGHLPDLRPAGRLHRSSPASTIGMLVTLARPAAGDRSPRRHGRRVAGRGRRPGLPRPAPDPAPSRGGPRMSRHHDIRRASSTPASSASAATAPPASSPTTRSASASTPPTSGSASGPASSRGASPPPTSRVVDMCRRGRRQGDRPRRHRRRPGRLRHPGHGHSPAADAVGRSRCGAPARRTNAAGVRHLGRLRRLLLRRLAWPTTWSAAAAPKYVLVIGCEKLSDFTDSYDRGSAFIFGDGAGAVVIGPSDTPGIGPTVWGSDGSQYDAITQRASWIDVRDHNVEFPHADHAGPEGLPLGRMADGTGCPAGAGRGRRRRPTTWTRSSPTRPTCASPTP